MKQIKINILPITDNEQVSGIYQIQRNRRGTWINEQEINVVSGTPGAERTLLLDEDQRLVVDVKSNNIVFYDKEQMAARTGQAPVTRRPSPVEVDGDEESPAIEAVELAKSGEELQRLRLQEEKDKAIAAARLKLKQQQDAQKAALPKAEVPKEGEKPKEG